MPTYEYICKKCKHMFELFQSMFDAPRKTCPECKGAVRRLVSGGSGLIFKGSGFYLTDYKNKKSSKVSGGTPRTRHAHYLENVARYRKENPPKSPKKPKVYTPTSMTTRSKSNSSK